MGSDEADVEYESTIIKVRYGFLFSESELEEIKESLRTQARTSDALKTVKLDNGDEPSLVFKPLRRLK